VRERSIIGISRGVHDQSELTLSGWRGYEIRLGLLLQPAHGDGPRQAGRRLQGVAVEQGIGGEPGSPATYVAMGHIYFESVSAADAAIRPHLEEITADRQNYTNVRPLIQVSEVRM
jgi:uncharacterized protein (TIGR02118 family)